MKALPNLTSLRFFLALFVVIFHVPQFCKNQEIPFFNDLAIFHKGQEAVYMFFSLSGFLIIRQLYIEKKQTNTIALKRFYIRRMLRIFPLYYLILGFGLFYYRFLLPTLGYEFESNYNLLEGILLSVFFLPNVFSFLYYPGGIIEVLWSIGIEEQFYLFIAPCIFFIKNKYIVAFLALFTIIYFAIFFSDQIPQLYRFGMYFFYFSSSGVASILLLNGTIAIRFANKALIVVMALFLLYFTTAIFKDGLSVVSYHLVSMLLFALFLSLMSLVSVPFFENKTLKYLGTISYGVYMFHAIVMQIVGFLYLEFLSKVNVHETTTIISFFALVILLTIGIAGLSYKYYESFFLKLKRSFR
nr:acyltransferase [uncultured Flavobacterium sp.]